MARRRSLVVLLSILGLFLLGTVVVLSSITYYLTIDPSAFLSELEVPYNAQNRWNATENNQVERIPRIIHQTWKTEVLPERWQGVSQSCRDMMPDYEYMLWTDAGSREFIAEHYPWFLETFDGYTYNIQRADAIRYFVLYHYGGVYIDLDIGCLRPMDQLLTFPVILPKTIPVGVSNDLLFAEKGHPFLDQLIHNLVTFDHSWVLNYPTVMFSTGPMFVSIQYALASLSSKADIRILPKPLYGKNALEGSAPHSFFSHYYGSSWHADDAAFIGFLGHWGKILMWVGLVVLVIGVARMMLPGGGKSRRYMSRYRGYVLLPRLSHRGSGSWALRWSSPSDHTPDTSDNSEIESPTDDDNAILLPFSVRPSSPSSSSSSSTEHIPSSGGFSDLWDTVHNIRNRLASLAGFPVQDSIARTPVRPRRRTNRGVFYFLPAIRAPAQSPLPRESQWLPEKRRLSDDMESATFFSDGTSGPSTPGSPLLDTNHSHNTHS